MSAELTTITAKSEGLFVHKGGFNLSKKIVVVSGESWGICVIGAGGGAVSISKGIPRGTGGSGEGGLLVVSGDDLPMDVVVGGGKS